MQNLETPEYQDEESNIQEEGQPQLDEKDIKLQELEARTREYEEKMKRMERGYQEVQSQRDKLINDQAAKLAEILKSQQKPTEQAQFNSESDYDKYWDNQANSILNAYNNGDITEIDKDRQLIALNRDVMDKKAKFIAEKQINEYKTEYQQSQKTSAAQQEFEKVWHSENITEHKEKETPFFRALLETINTSFDPDKINPFDSEGRFKGDPKQLKAAIEMTKLKHPELSGGQQQKQQKPAFTGIHTAQGVSAPVVDQGSNKIDVDPQVMAMIKSTYGDKTAGMIMKKLQSGKMSYGG